MIDTLYDYFEETLGKEFLLKKINNGEIYLG